MIGIRSEAATVHWRGLLTGTLARQGLMASISWLGAAGPPHRSGHSGTRRITPAHRSTIGQAVGASTSVFAVAASPRYRAAHRRRLTTAARHGMVLAALAAGLDIVWLVPIHRDAAVAITAINGAVALSAAVGYFALTTVARRRPELTTFAFLILVELAMVIQGLGEPGLNTVVSGYLLLLPTIVALMIPWATRSHVAWLGAHATFVLSYGALPPATAFPGGPDGGIAAVAGLLVISSSVSLFGHLAALRARVASFVQIQHIQALNRHARRDRLQLDHLNAALEDLARTDDLTGLRNRLGLKLDLVVVRSRIARHHERYGLLMLDLDRFKIINDRLGHIAGDDVLRAVARRLAESVRPEDAVYRFGGEEFVVLIKVARTSNAVAAADRLRIAIEGLRLAHPGNEPFGCVTVSAGISVVGPDDLEADDDAWIARSDAALYRAKENGRNRSAT